MLSIHEITESLPPVRDDEPTSLREEIAAEILDHLFCGLRRELLLSGSDEQVAWRRVLDKFGDPRQIARQLWFQAMWSKIMTQRLMIGLSSISVIVSVALALMVGWMIHRQSQDNALLLDRIAKLIPDPNSHDLQRDLNLNNLKIKVSIGSEQGPPATGYSIEVSKVPNIGEVQGNAASTFGTIIGKDGIEDCGLIGPGMFQVTLGTPWNESFEQRFTVYPGKDHVEHCVVPEKPAQLTRVTINLAGLPQPPEDSKSAFLCSIVSNGKRIFQGHEVKRTDYHNIQDMPQFLFVPSGNELWMAKGINYFNPYQNLIPDPGKIVRSLNWQLYQSPMDLDLPEGEYSVRFFIVRLKERCSPQDAEWKINVALDAPGIYSYRQLPEYYFASVSKRNEWTITVPDAVVKSVNEGTILPQNPIAQQGGQLGGGFF